VDDISVTALASGKDLRNMAEFGGLKTDSANVPRYYRPRILVIGYFCKLNPAEVDFS
jgi:hypothetical protein